MILILTESFDQPAQNVASILDTKFAEYKVIYGTDLLQKKFSVDITKNVIEFDNDVLDNINIVWYRRWISSKFEFSNNPEENIYLKSEFEELSSNFMLNIPTKKWLNIPPYINPYPTKAKQLKQAIEFGLNIPRTNISNNKITLQEFYRENKENIITKSLYNPYTYYENDELYCTYTTQVDDVDIQTQENLFFPSLFQNNIKKYIELRIFYFLGKFYSYAIFSSQNQQTSVDFRVYDHNYPNRLMKYELPKEIKKKLTNFMTTFNLHTGSIDMIIDEIGTFHFLEVNPQGQFGGMLDLDLDIENDIATYLIENNV
ncbi:hypothetical protein J2X97_002251 [Epilithonimonas hungarica]|uniref:hypothetical protein n=1 Tax=Epilithonimonas hungarica TaxID=454006 RepID=UPI002785534B|nr:hypothetical protein [Epilithonimonas hungarica]MDP9956592.1 hypothetical protein [Epilithonimonas hungarica]